MAKWAFLTAEHFFLNDYLTRENRTLLPHIGRNTSTPKMHWAWCHLKGWWTEKSIFSWAFDI